MPPGTVPDLDALLAHADWVQDLGRHLCRDPHAAADATQDTWLAAVRTPPRDGRNLRGFLATLLRNALRMRAREARRRTRREHAAAGAGFAEAAADAAARAELHRQLVQQVLALPEPQRALVLLHYFEGAPVAALARRFSFTADAVRAHLRRARDTLRLRLRHGDPDGRRGWALLAAAPAPPVPFSFSFSFPVTLMALTLKTKLALATAAAAVAALLLWQIAAPPGEAPATAGAGGALAAAQASLPDAGPGGAPAAGPRVAVAPAAAPAAGERTVRCRLTGLHRDATWTAAVQIDLAGRDEMADQWLGDAQRTTPAADGSFTLRLPPWAATCAGFEMKFRADDPLYLPLEVKEQAFAPGRFGASDVYELPVQVVAVLTGRVVDPRGEPVAAARVCALPWQHGKPGGSPNPRTNTAADGSFRLAAPMAAELLVVAIPMHGATSGERRALGRHGAIDDDGRLRDDLLAASVPATSRFGAVLELGTMTLPAAAAVTGTVLEADGRPVAGAGVHWQPDLDWDAQLEHLQLEGTRDGRVHVAPGVLTPVSGPVTDAEGRFRVAAPAGMRGHLLLTQGRRWFEPFVAPREATPPAHVVFQLAPPIVVRVVRGDQPVAGVPIATAGPFGTVTLTDGHGEVRLLRDQAIATELKVMAPGVPALRLDVPAAAPAQPFVVQLETGPLTRVALQVDGDPPVRQIEGWLVPLDRQAGNIGFSRFRDAAANAFRLEAPPGRYRLQLVAPAKAERRDTFVLGHREEVVVGTSDTVLAVRVRHGGRIAIDVHDARGIRVVGDVRLVAAGGVEVTPFLGSRERGRQHPAGRLVATETSETCENLTPGSYEVVLDLGAHGNHRRTVVVRPCEVTAVKITLP